MNSAAGETIPVHGIFHDVHFDDGEITSDWYNGQRLVRNLELYVNELYTIHADAFFRNAFKYLYNLKIRVKKGMNSIGSGAFNGLSQMSKLHLETERMEYLPSGVFDYMAVQMITFELSIWPNNVNLNEMFAFDVFHNLRIFEIWQVQWPRTQFRHLDAANFSFTRRLKTLSLINCGIETIDRHTFALIGRKLEKLNLAGNRIQTIDVDTFQQLYETGLRELSLVNNTLLACTCSLIELDVMQCPLRHNSSHVCMECTPTVDFDATACDVYRDLNRSRIYTEYKRPGDYAPLKPIMEKYEILRIIKFRLAHVDEVIHVATNFTTYFRMLLIDLRAIQVRKCIDRVAEGNFRCLRLNKSTNQLPSKEIGKLRDAEFMLVVAMPIRFWFGVRPLHSIMVSKAGLAIENPPSGMWIWTPIIIGLLLGFVIGIWIEFVSVSSAASVAAQPPVAQRLSYGYIEPSRKPLSVRTSIENGYEEIFPAVYLDIF